MTRAHNFKDLTGQKFNGLTVLQYAGKVGRGQAAWVCRCECGNETTLATYVLRRGSNKSCGCMQHVGEYIALAGQKFGRLTALERVGTKRNCAVWRCSCECGGAKIVGSDQLRRGQTQSCGCLRTEALTVHGDCKSSEYKAWTQMKGRCNNANGKNWKDYGGRGITVCVRWQNSYADFLADMGRKPSPQHSLDREDNDKGYSPDNCRWATKKEQVRNRRCSPKQLSTQAIMAACTQLGYI